jgi:diguanylate cyclase (GGDEF)-like protein/PAS domain S-box-containing protein
MDNAVVAEMKLQSAEHASLPSRLHKLIIGTALIVGAIIGATALLLVQLHQSTLHEVQAGLLRQSLTLSELVERTFQSADVVLADAAAKIQHDAPANGKLNQFAGQSFYDFLNEKASGLPQIDALGFINAQGIRVNRSIDWPNPPQDLSRRTYFQVLKANPNLTYYVSAPLRGSAFDDWVVVLARPVRANDGKFLGVVFASTMLKYYKDLFRATALGEGYAVTLMRQDGTLLTRYPAAGSIGMKVPESALKLVADSRSGVSSSISPVDGRARITAAYRLSRYPLIVIATQDDDAAFAGWRTTAVTMGLTAAAMIGIIVIAAWLIARSWKQQERLNAARAEVIEAEKVRALAEAELNRQRELAEQSLRFSAAVENMSQGLCMFDKEKKLVVCNRLYARIYKLPAEMLEPGTPHREIIAHRVSNGILKGVQGGHAALERHLSALASLPLDRRSTRIDEHSDGKLIRVTREPLPGGGWVATHADITEPYRAGQELDETKRFLNSIIQNVPAAVVVKDAKTRRIVLVNRAFEEMIDRTADELLDRTVIEFNKPEAAEFITRADSETLLNPNSVNYCEYEVETLRKGLRIHSTKRIVICDSQDDPKYLIAVIEDVTKRRKTEQRIAFMAHHDALTGLANRSTAVEKIDEAAARQRRRGDPFTVLLLDLDRFKYVNDTLGHSAGDALLRQTGMRLKSILSETDVLARIGGDEFAIIQPGHADQREAASRLADRIIAAFAKPFDLDANELNIGTSIGIALAPEHGTGPDNLLKMADMALYSAKSAGRNGYRFFDPDMGVAASTRHALENELRRAIQQNELELHYQPIIDAKTSRISAVEALVRWRHPSKGLIMPDRFIPLAEDTGQIAQIGEWVLHTACADAVNWPDRVKVAVNLSPVQFRKLKVSDVVMAALRQSGLSAERLELEITETALIESAAECLPALRQFRNAGITIALDDFGTGYSSLSQLTMFPFDKIKIDKSFTQNLTKRAECAGIIAAVLTLAQNLDIATTAEGVETAEQYQLLRLAGVTSLQGYLFKRPGPASEIDFDFCYSSPVIAAVA